MALEYAHGIAHLHLTDLLVDGCKSGCVHGVPLGDHCQVVGHDVPECESQTLIVLGDIQNRSYISTVHAHCLRVLAPDGGVDHWSLDDAYLELLDQSLNRGRCGAGQSHDELRGSVDPGGGDLDEQLLAAAEDLHISIVAGGNLEQSFDLLSQGTCIGNNIVIELPSLDLPAASGYLSSLQGTFDAGQIDGYSSLCERNKSLHGRVLERADGAQVDVALQKNSAVAI